MNQEQITEILKNGGVGVMPTDTIYGLVGQALKPKTVARIYKLKQRPPNQPFIILISDIADLEKFKITLGQKTREILNQFWPGPISVVLSKKIACRLPRASFSRRHGDPRPSPRKSLRDGQETDSYLRPVERRDRQGIFGRAIRIHTVKDRPISRLRPRSRARSASLRGS